MSKTTNSTPWSTTRYNATGAVALATLHANAVLQVQSIGEGKSSLEESKMEDAEAPDVMVDAMEGVM